MKRGGFFSLRRGFLRSGVVFWKAFLPLTLHDQNRSITERGQVVLSDNNCRSIEARGYALIAAFAQLYVITWHDLFAQ